MNGQIQKYRKFWSNINSNTHDFTRAEEWAKMLKAGLKKEPALATSLGIDEEIINKRLHSIALRRGLQLLNYLRTNGRYIPAAQAQADTRHIKSMIEKGILSYGDLQTSDKELALLAAGNRPRN